MYLFDGRADGTLLHPGETVFLPHAGLTLRQSVVKGDRLFPRNPKFSSLILHKRKGQDKPKCLSHGMEVTFARHRDRPFQKVWLSRK